jgi:SAM-dependent methyltransferase
MSDRSQIGLRARDHFEELWGLGDPWSIETSEFEQGKYDLELELLKGRRYGRVLELGCGNGAFTRRLSTIADNVLAVDIAESAIERTKELRFDGASVEFRVSNFMEWDFNEQEPWDLITLGDTISCLGWLYTFLDIACLAAELFTANAPGGRLLLADACTHQLGSTFRPWVIRSYRDVFRNVGYELEREETYRGVKQGLELEALLSVFRKPPEDAREREQALWQ